MKLFRKLLRKETNKTSVLTKNQTLNLKAIDEENKTLNPKFHRSAHEENLAFKFSQKYSSELSSLEKNIYNEVSKIKLIKSNKEKIDQCQKAIAVYEDAKKFCYKKGKGGELYFNDMWEHCHNSKKECFSYIQNTKDLLIKLTSQNT
jgi:hydroxymethylpyrimidine pyrophosphatase-like HAD family hydrolase